VGSIIIVFLPDVLLGNGSKAAPQADFVTLRRPV
jgi:hypothetical protein